MSPIIRSHQAPWLLGVKGDEVPALITATAPFIRVEAGPGTGKTFGLVRRVLRLFHPTGANAGRGDVLVVAFNRVIAKQLSDEIGTALAAAFLPVGKLADYSNSGTHSRAKVSLLDVPL